MFVTSFLDRPQMLRLEHQQAPVNASEFVISIRLHAFIAHDAPLCPFRCIYLLLAVLSFEGGKPYFFLNEEAKYVLLLYPTDLHISSIFKFLLPSKSSLAFSSYRRTEHPYSSGELSFECRASSRKRLGADPAFFLNTRQK